MRYNVRNADRVQAAAERARYMAAQLPDCDEAVLVAALDELQERVRIEERVIEYLHDARREIDDYYDEEWPPAAHPRWALENEHAKRRNPALLALRLLEGKRSGLPDDIKNRR